jgi:hypothetical protein
VQDGFRRPYGVPTGRSYSRFRITRQWNWRAIFIGPSGDLKAGGLESMLRSGKPLEGMRVYRDVERRALRPDRQSATIVGNQRDMTLFRLLAIPLTTEQVPFPGSTS